MAQDIASSSFCSVIQVDKDISFVLDSRDINFALAMPTDRQTGMPRKTYSKRHPITYPSVPVLEDNVNGSSSNGTPKGPKLSLKNTPKCTSTTSQKTKEIRRKRPLDTSGSKIPVPRKVRKKELPGTKALPPRMNGRFSGKFQRSSESFMVPPQDSEIEILRVIEKSTSKSIKRDSIERFNGKERNRDRLNDLHKKRNCKSLGSVLKPCYPSSNDVPSEADIAPVIPSNSVIPDTSISETNQDVKLSNKWVLPAISNAYSVQNGEIHSAKESAVNSADDHNLFESDSKVPRGRKFAGRELKNLYANLNEIYWAKEKNFKQMISNTDHRHSDRITAKAVDVEKSLRRMKAGSGKPAFAPKQKKALAKKNSATIALNRAKYGRLKPKLVLKKDLKPKPSINKVNKKALTKQIPKPTKKLKVALKNKNTQPKGVKNKAVVGLKQKAVAQAKPKQKAVAELKQKEPMPSSSKISKVAGIVSKKLTNNSQVPGKSIVPSALKKVVKTENGTQVISKSTSDRKIVKKFEYSDEVQIFGNNFGDNKVYTTALKKGSKLRVHVEPLEHTALWNSDFCEAFSKYVIQQSSSQMETKNKESIKAMFEELMDSWYNSPSENSKSSKKKKPEEEALRSSVRQSEGAFRYKEIVVKKHENYMQFILVPNAVKQNSLSIEAMKELKDAFLLAKKDPNCRAVLFNSSGTFFCTGIDLSQLVGNNKKQLAEEMATTIMDLVSTLSMFTKPIVAAVNGTAVGFGVTLLTLCDVVLASDKATFCIPATRLGYLPEGGLTYTLPPVTGATVATELLLYGRRLTADQALRHGLVSEVLWHSNLMNEVVPRVQVIVSQPLQVMEATKTMVRCQLWDRLRQHLEREWRLQPPLWLHAQCQSNMKKALQTGWLID